MGTACIGFGKIKQEVSLIVVAIVSVIFIIIGSTAVQVITNEQESKKNICQNYVQYPGTMHVNYQVLLVISALLATIFGLMFIRQMYDLIIIWVRKGFNFPKFVITLFFLIIFVIMVILSIKYDNDNKDASKNTHTVLNPTDSLLIDYCTTVDKTTDNLYIVFIVFFTIGIISIILYDYNFITSVCEIS